MEVTFRVSSYRGSRMWLNADNGSDLPSCVILRLKKCGFSPECPCLVCIVESSVQCLPSITQQKTRTVSTVQTNELWTYYITMQVRFQVCIREFRPYMCRQGSSVWHHMRQTQPDMTVISIPLCIYINAFKLYKRTNVAWQSSVIRFRESHVLYHFMRLPIALFHPDFYRLDHLVNYLAVPQNEHWAQNSLQSRDVSKTVIT